MIEAVYYKQISFHLIKKCNTGNIPYHNIYIYIISDIQRQYILREEEKTYVIEPNLIHFILYNDIK